MVITHFGRALILGLIMVGTCCAGDWDPMSRAEAIEALESRDDQERRRALGRLAEIGSHEDVPTMLRLLWDDNTFVRGMAEQAVWGLWLRVDDPVLSPLFQQGIEQIRNDNLEEAIRMLNSVIVARPKFAEAWNRLGDAYVHLGDHETALRNYMQALEFNPYHFGVMESCGSIWLARQELAKAAKWFRRALEINPNLVATGITLRKIEEELRNDNI